MWRSIGVLTFSALHTSPQPVSRLPCHRSAQLSLSAWSSSGSAVAYAFYWKSFVSVWCFFAAAGSVLILLHFERSRRQRLGLAAA
jgi:hypothetical protein